MVHYARQGKNAAIRISADDLATFAAGRRIVVVQYARRLSGDDIVRRAWSRVGERAYHLVGNNCEHFARWCSTGHHHSQQVMNATAATSVVAGGPALGAAAVGVVGSAGAAAVGAARLTSGLAEVGKVLGGGSVAGIGMLAAAPAIVGTAAMWRALRDDACLPDQERMARRVGRQVTATGAMVGVATSVGIVYFAGSIPGLSAAGITSGLAAIGGVVGAGMSGGILIASGLAGLIAALLGYAAYRVVRWIHSPSGDMVPVLA